MCGLFNCFKQSLLEVYYVQAVLLHYEKKALVNLVYLNNRFRDTVYFINFLRTKIQSKSKSWFCKIQKNIKAL